MSVSVVVKSVQRGRGRLGWRKRPDQDYEGTGRRGARTPEIGLWVAVLKQQIDDATEGHGRERARARAWLLSGSHDFHLVVDYAGLDPQAVLDRVMRLASRSWRTPQQWSEFMGR